MVLEDKIETEELLESSGSSDSLVESESAPSTLVQSVVYTLPDKYEIIEQVGRGGMGTVFKARHKDLNEIVAVKVVNPELLLKGGETTSKRFLAEAKAASRLKHPNLISLRDYGVTTDGAAYMVMDYAEGESLEQLLKRKGKLTVAEALPIVLGICTGLIEAHENGLVHRDIKPANILLSPVPGSDGAVYCPRILDFGVARVTSGSETQGLTGTGEIFGSPLYMAPEQGLSSKVDARADLYSLGCLLFEMLTGSPPYAGETAIQTVMLHLSAPLPDADRVAGQTLPHGLGRLLNFCLQKSPDQRYQTVADLKRDLERVLSGKPALYEGVGSKQAGVKATRPKQFLVFALSAAISLLSLLFLFHSLQVEHGPSQPLNTAPVTGIVKATTGGRLVDKALNMDSTKAFQAFNEGDYESSALMLKGAIVAYGDEIARLKIQKAGKSGEAARKLEQEIDRLTGLMADDLHHVGDCFLRLGQKEEAMTNFAQAIKYYRLYALRGWNNGLIDDTYEKQIALLQGTGRTKEAQVLTTELTEIRKSRH
ncbi:MAG TPA: serine/threonine-protein kinase [Candidatus Obscuribacter sp.]|nr:serine/threonine-protein kinase [Candidatus Obscuribacter sp.]HMY52297.1 serine/threonine-protein kinase [Candidatus Obscuribacter sp.]